MTPLCEKYGMTHTDMIILLCLASNPQDDTATDIVERRKLTKSAVSMSVRALQEKGLVIGEHMNGNHRSIHLRVCAPANDLIEEGRAAQDKFFDILMDGFTDEEKTRFRSYFERMTANIDAYNKQAR